MLCYKMHDVYHQNLYIFLQMHWILHYSAMLNYYRQYNVLITIDMYLGGCKQMEYGYERSNSICKSTIIYDHHLHKYYIYTRVHNIIITDIWLAVYAINYKVYYKSFTYFCYNIHLFIHI